jgi:CHAD domain-containing protein
MGRLRRPPDPGAAARALVRAADDAAGLPRREALHAFRVALRRLRVLLATRRGRRLARKGDRREVGDLLDDTNAARDAQVELAWLAERAPPVLLRRARAVLRPEPPASVARRWGRLSRRLTGAFAGKKGRWSRRGARRAGARLSRRLRTFEGSATTRALHKARIAAKTLRYRLEPLGRVPGLPALPRLRALQRALGAVHDRDVLLRDLRRWARADPALRAAAARASAELRAERALRLAEARCLWRGPDFRRR